MGNRTVNLPWATVITTNGSEEFIPVTSWFSTQGIERFRGVSEIAALTGDLSVQLAYQVADSFNDPGASHGIADAHTGDGYNFPSDYTDPSANLTGKQLVRFGWRVKLTEGSDAAWARVSGAVQIVAV